MDSLFSIQPNLKYADDTCAICRVSYDSRPNACLSLKCGHLFHSACAQQSFMQSIDPQCPLCRARVKILSKKELEDLETLNLVKSSLLCTAKFTCSFGLLLLGVGAGTMVANCFEIGKVKDGADDFPESLSEFERRGHLVNDALIISSLHLSLTLITHYTARYRRLKNCAQEILYIPPLKKTVSKMPSGI